jgi:hypothetical protein
MTAGEGGFYDGTSRSIAPSGIARNRTRGPDYPNGERPFPDAGLPSDCLLFNYL